MLYLANRKRAAKHDTAQALNGTGETKANLGDEETHSIPVEIPVGHRLRRRSLEWEKASETGPYRVGLGLAVTLSAQRPKKPIGTADARTYTSRAARIASTSSCVLGSASSLTSATTS